MAPEPDLYGFVTRGRDGRAMMERIRARMAEPAADHRPVVAPVPKPIVRWSPEMTAILETTAEITGRPASAILGRGMTRQEIWARHLCFWLIKQKSGLSNVRVGRRTGFDPSSILHALRLVRARRNKEPMVSWLAHDAVAKLLTMTDFTPFAATSRPICRSERAGSVSPPRLPALLIHQECQWPK